MVFQESKTGQNMKYLMLSAAALALTACGNGDGSSSYEEPADAKSSENAADDVASDASGEKLSAILDAQSEETKARYQYRHPKETLEFLGIEPGMTVVDTLPGSVWYAGILSEYLGPEGRVIGAAFSLEMRMAIGGRYASEEWQSENANWPTTWTDEREADREEGEAPFSGFFYGSMPDEFAGTADVVMVVRAAHHLNRIEEGRYFDIALSDINKILKPGGVIGVIQHRAPEEASDEWAVGNNGYVKQSQIIAKIENAGFELVEISEINANPNDQPSESDKVWRLPPTLGVNKADEDLVAQMQAIGESDRMTLKFRKPLE